MSYPETMTDRAAKLLEQALQLSEAERSVIADALFASLEAPEPSPEEEVPISPGWRAEILRRAESALRGEPGIPWESVRQEAEERLRRRRR